MKAKWHPDEEIVKSSNIYSMMEATGIRDFEALWKWSVEDKASFWEKTVEVLDIRFARKYSTVLDLSEGEEKPVWFKDGELNIVDSCLQSFSEDQAITYTDLKGSIHTIDHRNLAKRVRQMACSLDQFGVKAGDRIAIDMPMTPESVIIYLGAVYAGVQVATIADSFAPKEIATRISITRPKLVFTQDVIHRSGKTIPLYEKVVGAQTPRCVVVSTLTNKVELRDEDLFYDHFLIDQHEMESVKQSPDSTITILFSSGTTGEPKAIPWNHVTPIKGAADGFYHHNIQEGDVVCWPTNLGWMMGPWLIFAALLNKGSIALYHDAPFGRAFGDFVESAGVTMLGVVPSIVRQWKLSREMEACDWNKIKCFSSTGEASSPDEMSYLMDLAGNKPVIEYCGGTEIGGGYISSTMVQPNIPSTFSSPTLGTSFLLLDDEGQETTEGELFIIPPIPGLSLTLLNRNHHDVYFKGTPRHQGVPLRRHGDRLRRLENGYFKAGGRADDAMNLGGIKISSLQIESVLNQLDFVKESAAVGVDPDGGGPTELHVFAVCHPSDYNNEEQLAKARSLVRSTLNPLFKISGWHRVELLPRTASGKVMRRKLRNKI